MKKNYTALGLMSGTSMDGVDISIVQSDGENNYNSIYDDYYEYKPPLYKNLINLRDKIIINKDLDLLYEEIKSLEKEITLFHVKIVNEIAKNRDIDLIGFHGQTIYHNASEKISKQLGDGELLSELTKKKVIYNFRESDLLNGGQGAPLASIFHKLLVVKNKISLPVCILNIGGIANITIINSNKDKDLQSFDIGPGNCLIDEWIRKKIKEKYDKDGKIASLGQSNKIILDQALDIFYNQKIKDNLSFDIKDFDLNFIRGLSLEDGAATLTDFTGTIIADSFSKLLLDKSNKPIKVLVCGGGRKNISLLESINRRTLKNFIFSSIDNYGINGDFVESQAFAYLAIRTYLKLPISFPGTTGCKKPTVGGKIIQNF